MANCELERRVESLENRVMLLETAMRTTLQNALCDQSLITKYGESVDKTVAAQILGVTRATVYTMIKDGRISECGKSKRVSVRSIMTYLGLRNESLQSGRKSDD